MKSKRKMFAATPFLFMQELVALLLFGKCAASLLVNHPWKAGVTPSPPRDLAAATDLVTEEEPLHHDQKKNNKRALHQRGNTNSDAAVDIVAILPNRGSAFRNSIHNSLHVSSHRNNVTLEIRDCGSFNADICNEVFEQAVASNDQPKVYIIWPINNMINDWMKILHDVHDATIIQLLNLPDEEGWEYTAGYAGQNEYDLGYVPASMMIEAMRGRNVNEPVVLVLQYSEGIPKGHRIKATFEDSFNQMYPDSEIEVVYPKSSSAQSAYLAILDYFQDDDGGGGDSQGQKKQVHGIFCMGDIALMGAYQALEDMRTSSIDGRSSSSMMMKDDITLVGMGCNGARELLESGAQYATALAAPYLMGSMATKSAVEYIKTGNISNPIGFAPSPPIRSTELDTMLIDVLDDLYTIDELCTWDMHYERVAGLNDVTEVPNICRYINCEFIPEQLFLVGYIMVGTNYVLAILAGILLYYYRDKAVMKLAQPGFLGLVAFGCMVDTTSIIFMSRDNQNYTNAELDAACFAWPWLMALGHMMTTATLVSKMYRVKKVCMADGTINNLKRTKVTAKQASGFIIGFLSLDLVILSVWYGIDPFRWTLVVSGKDAQDYIADAYGTCKSETIAFPLILIIVHFLVLMYANMLSYQTRKIHKISDSKFVAIAVFNSIQLLLVAMPILLLVNDNVGVSYMIRICFVFLNTFWVLLLVVYSKIYVCVKGRGDDVPNLRNIRNSITFRDIISNPTTNLNCSCRSTNSNNGFLPCPLCRAGMSFRNSSGTGEGKDLSSSDRLHEIMELSADAERVGQSQEENTSEQAKASGQSQEEMANEKVKASMEGNP